MEQAGLDGEPASRNPRHSYARRLRVGDLEANVDSGWRTIPKFEMHNLRRMPQGTFIYEELNPLERVALKRIANEWGGKPLESTLVVRSKEVCPKIANAVGKDGQNPFP